jgi:hypothetical protein
MKVQAAVVQAAPIGFDREQTMDKLERLIAEAAAGGAQLAVFPEAFVPAYPRGIRLRNSRRAADAGRSRSLQALLRWGDRGAWTPRRPDGNGRARAWHLLGRGGLRTRRRNALLHRALLQPGGLPGKASQADAHGRRTTDLGIRRRLDPPRLRHIARTAWRSHLLGELHADAADDDVRQGHPDLLCADGRQPGDVRV